MTARTSFTPAVTAESSVKTRPDCRETSVASVVLPVPGGPHNTTETAELCGPLTSDRSGDPSANAASCPTTSSIDRGRIRTASGAPERSACSRSSNKVTAAADPSRAAGRHSCVVVCKRVYIDAGLGPLLFGDRTWCPGEWIVTASRLREGDHIAKGIGPR